MLSSDRPALRQDITTGEWVIMAPARAQRPQQFAMPTLEALPPYAADCPFCPGQEAHTPPPIVVVSHSDQPAHWALRVIPNKFPALVSDRSIAPSIPAGCFPTLDGVGHHEVIIECPEHNGQLSRLLPSQITLLVRTWQERFLVLQTDPQIQMISLFKNHGGRAGASLSHPHTQILALPIRSAAIQGRQTLAQQYYRTHQRCLHCALLAAELADDRRLVCANASYVAYQPYAARFPFETWIVPRQHQACFVQVSGPNIAALALLLQECMQRLDLVLYTPEYNLMLHTALRDEMADTYHWFLQIMPRVVGIAGFELSTGMAINAVLPETAAAVLRRAALT